MNVRDFIANLPQNVPSEVIGDMETLFHFSIGDMQRTVTLKDGVVTVDEGLHGDPKCEVSGTEENMNKILNGELNAMMAVMTGKLKISNPAEMMKYAKIFGLM